MSRLWTTVGVVGAALAALTSLGLTSEPLPDARAIAPTDAPAAHPRPGYLIVPPRVQLTPQAKLERRLAALAAEVEARNAGQPAPSGAAFEVDALANEIEHTLERVEARAQASVHVRDLRTGRVLFDHFGDTPLNPASNQKVLTSAAALELLGPEYTFTTDVIRSGRDLYLRGHGDPTLSLSDLRAMAALVLQQVDVHEFDRVVVDDFAFSPERFGPGYPKEGPGFAYQAPSGALSLDFNTVEITVAPVKGEAQPAITLPFESGYFTVVNKAWTGRRGGLGVSTRVAGAKTVVEVAGRLSRRARPVTIRRRVHDPGLYTGSAFAAVLAELSSSEPLPVARGHVPRDADVVLTNESAPLLEVLDSGLAYSNNFTAEQVLRTVAWRMTGQPGDWQAGQEILAGYWSALVEHPESLVIENASGLSRQGRLTTHGLVDLISVAYRTATPGQSLIDALPVAGEPGTLRSRLRMSGKRVRAKTGTLYGVSGLTGVITSEAGAPQVAFSILINVDEGVRMVAAQRRRVEDHIVMDVLHAVDRYEAARGLATVADGG